MRGLPWCYDVCARGRYASFGHGGTARAMMLVMFVVMHWYIHGEDDDAMLGEYSRHLLINRVQVITF